MSTRSNIGYKTEDGRLAMIYCHYDGYPDHVGTILNNFHNSEAQAKALVAGNQIRCFDADGSYERFEDGSAGGRIYEDVKDAMNGFEYVYVFENGKWQCFKEIK